MSDLIARLESITFQYDEEVITTLRTQAKEIEQLRESMDAAISLAREQHDYDRQEIERLRSALRRYLPVIERAENQPDIWVQLTEGTGIATANGYRAALKGDGDE